MIFQKLDFGRTTWELRKLVGNLAEMAIVICVICMTCKTGNISFSFKFVIVCTLETNAHLFFDTSPLARISLGASGFYYFEVGNEDDFQFLRQDSNQLYYFISGIMNFFLVWQRPAG